MGLCHRHGVLRLFITCIALVCLGYARVSRAQKLVSVRAVVHVDGWSITAMRASVKRGVTPEAFADAFFGRAEHHRRRIKIKKLLPEVGKADSNRFSFKIGLLPSSVQEHGLLQTKVRQYMRDPSPLRTLWKGHLNKMYKTIGELQNVTMGPVV